MSHSKHTKRGYSIYLEKWNPSSKRYINTCAICGSRGYSPVIEAEDFDQKSVFQELKRTLPRMEIDEYGRCNDCAEIMDKVMNNEGESYGRIN
ncbi:MAG: hypothetical protein ILP17_09135 [Lachnospiraceae bacterium]|nr:hypothetical protein [Lachnospiraceae bacterium]